MLNGIDKKNQYLFSILSVCVISAGCFLFSDYVGSEAVAFILLLTLSVIAMFFDIFPVLLAAVLSALIWDYFFLLPRFNLRVGNIEDRIMLSMYFIIALVNAALTFKVKEIRKIARLKEEKAQTLKLYDTLLNSLSHELRTPIATIIGATDSLIAGVNLSSVDKQILLYEISAASLRLNRQVENLLNMSRLQSGLIQLKKDWCDVSELIYGAVKRLEEQLRNHTVSVDIKEGLPLVQLDFVLMEQVLYNLIYNAALYTPAASLIKISADFAAEQLVITVEDNGNGFPDDEIEKAFEKFYRLKNTATGGTGLGLSIAKGFTEAHDGSVVLTNIISGGARFEITIPARNLYLNI